MTTKQLAELRTLASDLHVWWEHNRRITREVFQCDKVHDIPSERYQDVVFAYHCVGGLPEAEADTVIRQLASRPR